MTVKERLHQLVERLPEELPETAIGATENALGPYMVNGVPWTRPTPEMMEERRAAVRAGLGSMKYLGISSEDYYRRQSEEIDLEEEQSARRMSGQG